MTVISDRRGHSSAALWEGHLTRRSDAAPFPVAYRAGVIPVRRFPRSEPIRSGTLRLGTIAYIPRMAARARSPRRRATTGMKAPRVRLAPLLTKREVGRLEARAAADLRSTGNYVAYLIAQDLREKPRKRRRLTSAKVLEERPAPGLTCT